jgi:hypothetical protein
MPLLDIIGEFFQNIMLNGNINCGKEKQKFPTSLGICRVKWIATIGIM